ncbi:hypothetical protein [Flavobacterium nackdongense]|uniref:Uncharacterized protein n=1 Tax=Flavobacterium nackdongense TaxID=2547394 RepID=A0A4P6Y6X0_9FLAO|nr:hypothetical protein [Flavobacterium nackdongense]QBN18251.1 hypothetical protein E1750_05325 [Flavobacterium nackdongense]
MSDDINFKDLWTQQKCVAPHPENLIFEVKKLKQNNLRKLLLTNLLLLVTALFIILIWTQYQPQFLTTKIGIILIILAIVVFLFAYNNSYSLFKSDKNAESNSDYLKDLLTIKAKQKFMETTMVNVYFVLLSIGIGLYMYEYTSRMTSFWGIFAYGITAIWILLNWFYLRPKQIKKQQTKLDEIITKIELLNQQLE